jgi:hypothetical protein
MTVTLSKHVWNLHRLGTRNCIPYFGRYLDQHDMEIQLGQRPRRCLDTLYPTRIEVVARLFLPGFRDTEGGE